jgi:hypothetical protein
MRGPDPRLSGPGGGLNQMASDLRKHHARYTAGTREDNQRYMKPWARREPGPGGTDDIWRTDRGGYRRSGTPLATRPAAASPGPSGRVATLRRDDAGVSRRRASRRPLAGMVLPGSVGGRLRVHVRYMSGRREGLPRDGGWHCCGGPKSSSAGRPPARFRRGAHRCLLLAVIASSEMGRRTRPGAHTATALPIDALRDRGPETGTKPNADSARVR